jgi:hypothetical protein
MIDMSNDSSLFKTDPGSEDVRLYESKMTWILDHRYGDFEGATQANLNQGTLPQVSEEKKKDPKFRVSPRYYVPNKEVESRLTFSEQEWLIGFRDVTNSASERTAIFSIIPKVGVGNNLPLIFLENISPSQKVNFIGCLSSLVFDFIARQKIAGLHMNFFFVKQLPVLFPNVYNKFSFKLIIPMIVELVFTAYDINEFAIDLGYNGPPFIWDDDRRALIFSELDAYFARLYGLNRKQLRYILDPADLTQKELEDILDPWEEVADPLDPEGYQGRTAASTFPGETFRVLKEKEIKQYGEYRTRRLVLEAWERMQQAIDEGREYVSMVDPPPADPSMAHPWPDGTPYEGPGLVLDETLFEEEKPKPKPPAKKSFEIREPQPELPMEHTPQPIDWDLYKCKGCGQILAGFARYEHVRDAHKGIDPGFGKFKEN